MFSWSRSEKGKDPAEGPSSAKGKQRLSESDSDESLEGVGDGSGSPKAGKDRVALTLSTLIAKESETGTNLQERYNTFDRELSKTVQLRNVPHDVSAQQIVDAARVKGGVKSVYFFPKGRVKSALVEFVSYQGLSRRFVRSMNGISDEIRCSLAKICIRQALARLVDNHADRLSQMEEQIRMDAPAKEAMGARLSALERANSEHERYRERMATALDTSSDVRAGLEARVLLLEALNQRMRGELVDLRAELRETKRTEYARMLETADASERPGLEDSLIRLQMEDINEQRASVDVKEAERKQREQRERVLEFVHSFLPQWNTWARRTAQMRREEELTMAFLREEQARKQKELEAKEYTCPICYDDFNIEEMYTLDSCFHRFCFGCISMHLRVKITEGEAHNLTCPDATCGVQVSPMEVRHVTDDKLYAKYEEFTLKTALNNMEDLRWCPKPGCNNAMVGDSDNPSWNGMMVCSNPECKYSFCFNCKEEWHADATCEEFKQWKIENSEADAKYAEWVAEHARSCPGCDAKIEKNGGCNHMTCKACSFEFCWLCMKKYSSGHFGTMPWSCKQFS